MPDLKLPRLPDRRRVKREIQILPDLDAALADYEAAYGSKVSVNDLIPTMLESFLESDRSFMRNRRR